MLLKYILFSIIEIIMLKIFNPQGTDNKNDRKIFGGNSTGIINLNNVKFEWGNQLWRQMRENFWVAEKFDISQDVVTYNHLTSSERKAFDGIFAFLVFLDSVQTNNIPIFIQKCTAPEIQNCFSEQQSQETLHAQSYQYAIETIIPPEKREQIYDYWRKDEVLKSRCEEIASFYQENLDTNSELALYKALVADYVLESILFYMGFVYFYNLASRSLMCGLADIIAVINRDELAHVRLYQKILQDEDQWKNIEGKEEIVREMMIKASENEIRWNKHILGNDILGITHDAIEKYVKYLANLRIKALGFSTIYEGFNENPFKHLEKIGDTSTDAHVKQNFFDGTAKYQMATAVTGWDDF